MTVKRYHDGKLIILENESYLTNEQGIPLRRVELVLEDGTEFIQDYPMQGSEPTAYAYPSAPTEEEVCIPMVHATTIPESRDFAAAATSLPASTTGPFAVVTGPPEPPRVAVVTGPPRPPPQVYTTSSSRYIYRDERSGAWVVCGLSALVCLVICCCCFLPMIIIPVIWVTAWNDDFDDDFWNDDPF